MSKRILLTIFFTILTVWGYWYPYQWWIKYSSLYSNESEDRTEIEVPKSTEALKLPETFWGASLIKAVTPKPKKPVTSIKKNEVNVAGPVLDEIKACFGSGPLMSMRGSSGDLNQLLYDLQSELGPVQEDTLLEKRVILTMKDGVKRTLVYEWISPDEGSDVYWHELDEEGFPKTIDLPEGVGSDISSFESLKQYGNPGGISEIRLVQLQNNMQLGIEKLDEVVQNFSLKNDEHIIKCRRDSIRNFDCDCLN